MQPIIYCILFGVLCSTKTCWLFLRDFLLWIPSFLPSTFSFIVLFFPVPCNDSSWTAAYPAWLAEPLTLLTRSKIKRSYVLSCLIRIYTDQPSAPLFLSIPLPACVFKQEVLAFGAPHRPNFGVLSLFWRQRGFCCGLNWNQNFTPSIVSRQILVWQGEDKEQVASGV